MSQYLCIIFAVCSTTIISGIIATFYTNFVVNRVEICPNNVIELNATVTNETGKQYLNGYINLPFNSDENIGMSVKIESILGNNTVVPLFVIHEDNACRAFHVYLREFAYDIERRLGLLPGACPYRKGHYELHNYELNFRTIALQTFPFGRLKFSLSIVNNKRPYRALLCGFVIVTNMVN